MSLFRSVTIKCLFRIHSQCTILIVSEIFWWNPLFLYKKKLWKNIKIRWMTAHKWRKEGLLNRNRLVEIMKEKCSLCGLQPLWGLKIEIIFFDTIHSSMFSFIEIKKSHIDNNNNNFLIMFIIIIISRGT